MVINKFDFFYTESNKALCQVNHNFYEQGEVLAMRWLFLHELIAIALRFDTSDLEYVTITYETIKGLQVEVSRGQGLPHC